VSNANSTFNRGSGGQAHRRPIIRDKTFFFVEYEARRYPETFPVSVTVSTATLRRGILQYRDASGNIVAYNLATSSLCGPQGNQACDARGLGISPTMKAMMAQDSVGNNPSARGRSEHHRIQQQRQVSPDRRLRHPSSGSQL
jgi:hypothetical protein